MSSWLYIVRTAWRSILTQPGLALMTVGTMTATLLFLAFYSGALSVFEEVVRNWGKTADLTLYLSPDIDDAARATLKSKLNSEKSIKKIEYIAPGDWAKRAATLGPEEAALFKELDASLLPSCFSVQLHSAFLDIENTRSLARRLEKLSGVSEADFGESEFQELDRLLTTARSAGVLLGALLFLGTAFIIWNTIRLSIYARQEEISILKLVGATDTFVRSPFLFEGAFWGISAGLLAVLIVFLVQTFLGAALSDYVSGAIGRVSVELFSPIKSVGIVVMGMVLGLLGSFIGVRRALLSGVSGS